MTTNQVKNSLQEGTWLIYWEGNRLYSKGNYEKGKRVGLWKYYWFGGEIQMEKIYKNGQEIFSKRNTQEKGTILKLFTV